MCAIKKVFYALILNLLLPYCAVLSCRRIAVSFRGSRAERVHHCHIVNLRLMFFVAQCYVGI